LREARAAGFTFRRDLRQRTDVDQLGLSVDALASTQTVIVLPLEASVSSSERVIAALDETAGVTSKKRQRSVVHVSSGIAKIES
jgi:hypothetical protein